MDYMISNNLTQPGTVFDISSIPNLPKATTEAGRDLINLSRIKLLSDVIISRGEPTGVLGSADPIYTNKQGDQSIKDRAYTRARDRSEFKAGNYTTYSDDMNKYLADPYKYDGINGNRLDIRLNADVLNDPGGTNRLRSTLAHELSHNLDTVKGMNTIKDWDLTNIDAPEAEKKLKAHEEAKKLITPENPRPPGLITDPKEEKKYYGIIRKASKQPYAPTGSHGYYARETEINARLTQVAHDIDQLLLKGEWDPLKHPIKDIISWEFNKHNIAVCFVKFPSETEFKTALGTGVTQAQLAEAAKNSDYQKYVSRIYKFLTDETEGGGLLAQAQKNGFKNWANPITPGAKTASQTFLERFQQVVIKGVEAVKDVAKQVVRRYAQGTVALEKIIVKMIPEFMAKSGFKSIPLIGILFGVAFAIPRLFKGDAPGAGIEVASSVGSLFTVIPLVAYQIARDLYGEEYMYSDTGKPAVLEYDYANDPEGTKERIAELQDKIAKILKEKLQQNAPNYPMVFSNTAGGAAVGNPKIAAQGERSRSNRPTPEPTPTQPANGRGPGLGADVPDSIANIAQQSTKRP
jgi:hypothetical protein